MRPELETYHLIDSYLNGKLEGEALRSFEHKLQSDPAFAEEVSFQQLTNEVVMGASYDDLRATMSNDIKKIDAADKTKNWSLYTVAAFILITGAVSIYSYYSKTSTPKPTDTKESKPSIQSSVSPETPVTYNSTDAKTVTSKKDMQTVNPAVKNTAANVIDTPPVASEPQIQFPAPAQHTGQDIKTPQPAEQVVKTTKEQPCNLNAYVLGSPSCINENTGAIGIGGVTGGQPPYVISIPELSVSGRKGNFSYLKPGTYTVRIEDANGCVKVYPTEITEKNCRKNTYVFSPDNGETWKISGTENESYTITLINIAGTQVYKSQLMNGEFEWQGISQQGEYLSAGLYIYVIEYANGQKENGQVTIVR